MKKQMTSSVLKSIFTSAILVTVLFISSANATEKDVAKSTPSELKYVGKLREQPVFQLDIANLSKEDTYIRLEDESGNVLYTEKFNETSFSKKFQFDIPAGNSTKIKMNLWSKNVKQTQVFEISNVLKFVEDVVVTKVN